MSSGTSSTNDLEIKIGKYQFTLLAYNPEAYDRRGLLLIESKNLDTI